MKIQRPGRRSNGVCKHDKQIEYPWFACKKTPSVTVTWSWGSCALTAALGNNVLLVSKKSSGEGWRTALDKMKTLGGGKGWAPGILGLLFGGAQIYDAAQSGDDSQLAVTTAGVGGGALGAYGGAALGTMVSPGAGTGVGGVLGRILGSILGEEGMQALVDWFDGGKADQEIERLLPPPSIARPTEARTTPSPPQAIALSLQLAITISPDVTNTEDMETAIVNGHAQQYPRADTGIPGRAGAGDAGDGLCPRLFVSHSASMQR